MRRKLGQLRIIAGQWRSRLIDFDAADGVRPTPDRVRQTVFDWLSPRIAGAFCVDLFAGSGALGLEALSRGAGYVSFVENGPHQPELIRAALHKLQAANSEVVMDDALRFLSRTPQRYNLAFLDPPYATDLLTQTLTRLPRVLKPDNRIYLEWSGEQRPEVPAGYIWHREKKAGRVSYGLMEYAGETA